MPEGFEAFLLAKDQHGSPRVQEVAVKGKFMWWLLKFPGEEEEWFLWTTYGMSGQWSSRETKHLAFGVQYRAEINSVDQELFFNDPRHFGTIKIVRGSRLHEDKLRTLGPDILNSPPNIEIFRKNLLKKPARSICETLMDQSCVSGCGNYLRAEILYDCRIDPWRPVESLLPEEYESLHESTLRITRQSYLSQGASIKTYRNVDGSSGSTQFDFKVYGKRQDPAGNEVVRRQDAGGRMMHWCPNLQK